MSEDDNIIAGQAEALIALTTECDLLKADVARLISELDKRDNEEASVCPEDVGVVEYVKTLKAELFQAKAAAEHWQKRMEQAEKERAEFRDDAKRLKQERGDEPIRMPCAHNWVTASDAYITGTEICTKCGGLRAPRGG